MFVFFRIVRVKDMHTFKTWFSYFLLLWSLKCDWMYFWMCPLSGLSNRWRLRIMIFLLTIGFTLPSLYLSLILASHFFGHLETLIRDFFLCELFVLFVSVLIPCICLLLPICGPRLYSSHSHSDQVNGRWEIKQGKDWVAWLSRHPVMLDLLNASRPCRSTRF